MTLHADAIRLRLAMGPKTGTLIANEIGLSQPTVTRALAAMGDEVIKVGDRKFTRYFMRDQSRGFGDIPVYCVDASGKVKALGVLQAVRPDGFLFAQADGKQVHTEGLPWWLLDMRPQGFLGRAYAARYGSLLGLPSHLKEWSDSHAIRALLAHGHDVVGNVLLGTHARDQFIGMPEPTPIKVADKPLAYAAMAMAAAAGDSPGSSAAGEQPKFTAYAEALGAEKHVIVKFTEQQDSPNSRRWRDLLLAEHLALETLWKNGVATAQTQIIDHAGQRFLEVVRFDRVGPFGRRALLSLTALDAEFVGHANQVWPVITQSLAKQGVITPSATEASQLLYAYGALIGNTDMHNGNLSFVSEHGRPYQIAPAYDMTPMTFAPTSSGRLPDRIHPVTLHASVTHHRWQEALQLAILYLSKLQNNSALFSADFQVCIRALASHIDHTSAQIHRLG